MNLSGHAITMPDHMDDLAPLTATATGYAAAEHVALIPAVPEHDYGPEVRLGPADLGLTAFLELAGRLGNGVLYLWAAPFDPVSDEDAPADPPAHLVRRKGQIGQLTAAFAANGIVHFWEHRTSWYTEWRDLADGTRRQRSRPAGENPDDEDQDDEDDRLSDEDRALVADLAGTILADPQVRAAPATSRRGIAYKVIPQGTNDRVRWPAIEAACARANVLAEEKYGQIEASLNALAVELAASEAYQQVRSAAARKKVAERFLIQRADGFGPPSWIRDELAEQAKTIPAPGLF